MMWETPSRERSSYRILRPPRPVRRALRRVGGAWVDFAEWLNRLDLSEDAILLSFAVGIGTLAALGVVAFYRAIDLAYTAFVRFPQEWLPRLGFVAYRPVLTAAGLFAAWWIAKHIGRGYDGMNVPDVQRAVARRGGDLPPRPALARTAASAVTLGSGGSAGSEGPVAVLGAVIGSVLGRLFRFDPERVKVLVGAGAAAGISAAFNAPLAGAFFALEEIIGTFAVGSFPPVVVASVLAAVVSHGFLGNHPAFPIPEEYGYAFRSEVFLFYPLLGLAAGALSAVYVRVYFGTGDVVQRLTARFRIPPALVPILGGLFVGGLVVLSGGLLVGHGHLSVHLDLFGRLPWTTLALLALGSILATSVTLNTGGSGGLFTPSLYVGAAAGGAFGVALQDLFPALGLHPEAYALVGMGAVVAGATGAPITGILLVFEMTNDYGIVLPLMLAVVISHVVSRRFVPENLYSGWLRRRGEDIAHGSDRDVLGDLRVGDVYEPVTEAIAGDVPAATLLARLGRGPAAAFPVLDAATHRVVGVVSVFELSRAAAEAAEHPERLTRLTALDLATPVDPVGPGDSLLEAVRRMGLRGSPWIPVADPASGRLLGLVTRAHVIGAYDRAVAGHPEV
ncbi:MAG TPA: chloride channel protein [Gemmatimonadales bacterium]|nr:chloride channel protein [Gemmatimonadales bacterium]